MFEFLTTWVARMVGPWGQLLIMAVLVWNVMAYRKQLNMVENRLAFHIKRYEGQKKKEREEKDKDDITLHYLQCFKDMCNQVDNTLGGNEFFDGGTDDDGGTDGDNNDNDGDIKQDIQPNQKEKKTHIDIFKIFQNMSSPPLPPPPLPLSNITTMMEHNFTKSDIRDLQNYIDQIYAYDVGLGGVKRKEEEKNPPFYTHNSLKMN